VLVERAKPPRKWIVRVIIGLVIVSQGAALLGDLFLAGIVDREPALLIALNPRNRNLALATNQLSASVYYTVGFIRLVISDPLYFLLGYWYGERAIAWTERRSRTYGPLIRDGERLFRRASYPLIFLAPNNIICAMSAATGVRLSHFVALNLSGTVARLVLVRQLGEIFSAPIAAIVDFIARYRGPLLILSAIGVAWTVFGEFRKKDTELDTLLHINDQPDDLSGDPSEPSDPSEEDTTAEPETEDAVDGATTSDEEAQSAD
jgi:membrane protein DedA with SNARE-associated domain